MRTCVRSSDESLRSFPPTGTMKIYIRQPHRRFLASIPEASGFITADRVRRRPSRIGHPARAELPGSGSELHPHCWTAHSTPYGGFRTSPPHLVKCDRNQGDFELKPNISYFDGESCVEDYLDWEQQVDDFFYDACVPQEKQLRFVVRKLRGRARLWWTHMIRARHLEGRSEVRTWRKMKRLLREQFLSSEYETILEQQSREYSQEFRSVKVFTKSETSQLTRQRGNHTWSSEVFGSFSCEIKPSEVLRVVEKKDVNLPVVTDEKICYKSAEEHMLKSNWPGFESAMVFIQSGTLACLKELSPVEFGDAHAEKTGEINSAMIVEQFDSKTLTTEDELSIAVTKGEQLVQHCDSLKQLLVDQTTKLNKCVQELQHKTKVCLNGEFVRVGPNPKFPLVAGYLWFDGDGMINGLRIKDGKATYVSRYVKTSRLKQEEYFGGAKFMKVGDLKGLFGLFTFDPIKKARFDVLPRYAKDEKLIRWFDLPNCFIFHNTNAWEEGDEVVLITCCLVNPDLDMVNGAVKEKLENFTNQLYEMRYNLKTGAATQKKLSAPAVDFPRINENYTGRKQRYVYGTILDSFAKVKDIIKFDLLAEPEAGKKELEVGGNVLGIFDLGPGRFGSEAVFVPREDVVDRTLDRKTFRWWFEIDNPWTNDDETDDAEMTYVNLQLNPERHTGYVNPLIATFGIKVSQEGVIACSEKFHPLFIVVAHKRGWQVPFPPKPGWGAFVRTQDL